MASEKKRRKRVAQNRKLSSAPQSSQTPRPSKDGDRRRRVFGAMVREAIQRKQAQRDWNLDSEPLPPPERSTDETGSPSSS